MQTNPKIQQAAEFLETAVRNHVMDAHDPPFWALRQSALACGWIVLVSSKACDALTATWHGCRTLRVNRQKFSFEELGTQPHLSAARPPRARPASHRSA